MASPKTCVPFNIHNSIMLSNLSPAWGKELNWSNWTSRMHTVSFQSIHRTTIYLAFVGKTKSTLTAASHLVYGRPPRYFPRSPTWSPGASTARVYIFLCTTWTTSSFWGLQVHRKRQSPLTQSSTSLLRQASQWPTTKLRGLPLHSPS